MFATVGLCIGGIAMVGAASASGVFEESGHPSASAKVLGVLAVMALLGLVVTVYAWIRQIGTNAGRYGGFLVVAAILPWERLAFFGGEATSVSTVQTRVVVSLVLGLVASLAFRHKLIVEVWRCGRLEPPVVAEMIWLLGLLGWGFIAAATTRSVMHPIETRTVLYVSYSFEAPSPSLVTAGLVLSAISAVAWLGTLIAATVAQHTTISAGRRADLGR